MERNQIQRYKEGHGTSTQFVTAAATLTGEYQNIKATASSAWAITLPPVTMFPGSEFSFFATITSSGAVTVQDQDDSIGWTDLLLDTDGDECILYCTGYSWCVTYNSITS